MLRSYALLVSIFFFGPAYGQSDDVRVLAPHDGYVCFNSSLLECAQIVGAGDLLALGGPRLAIAKGSIESISDAILHHSFPGDYSVVESGDQRVRCENHGVPTIVLPSVNLKYRLVFFSPDLYAQTREALRRVEVAVSACRNLVERYHAQGRLQEEQEAQALAQDQAELAAAELALFSARISEYRDLEYCSNQHQGEKLKKCQEMLRIPRWVVKGSDIPVDEKNEKALHVVYSSLRSDAIYSRAKLAKIGRQVLEEEFVRQSKELSLALEGAIIEFSRTLLSLKQSARDVRPRKRITGKEMFWAQVESGSPVNRDQLVLLYRN